MLRNDGNEKHDMSDDEPHNENSEFDESEIGGEDEGNVETDGLPQLEQALERDMGQEIVEDELMDELQVANELAVNVGVNKYTKPRNSKEKTKYNVQKEGEDLLLGKKTSKRTDSHSQKQNKSKIISETIGHPKWHQKSTSIEDAQISFFKSAEEPVAVTKVESKSDYFGKYVTAELR